jgi:hypothetical protein
MGRFKSFKKALDSDDQFRLEPLLIIDLAA